MAYSPIGLMSSRDRTLHPLIAKVRVRFPVKAEFFQCFFLRLGCSFYCEDHVHFQKRLVLLKASKNIYCRRSLLFLFGPFFFLHEHVVANTYYLKCLNSRLHTFIGQKGLCDIQLNFK